jgi:putative DNA primase/helicase
MTADDAIAAAAKLPVIEYDQQRKKIAKELGVRTATLDDSVAAIRPKPAEDGLQGHALQFEEDEPHPEPVDAFALLNEISEMFERHIVLPIHAATAITLWCVWTYFVDTFQIAPMLGLTSATRRCAKTRTLGLVKRVVARPLAASNISPAAVYRAIEKWHPTLLADEGDSFMKDNDQLRGVLNSGHTRDAAFVIRSEGEDNEPRCFSTWSAKLWAAIGALSSTLMDRSIVIVLRRRARGEEFVKRFPPEVNFKGLRSRIVRWRNDHREELKALAPSVPDELDDRAADNWLPLLAIATAAGGDLPERCRVAALILSGSEPEDSQEINVALLHDIWRAFEIDGAERLHTEDLLSRLTAMPESAWATWHHGRPMTGKALADRLRDFSIKSKQIRIGEINRHGYLRTSFADAWSRYPIASATTATSLENQSTEADTEALQREGGSVLELAAKPYEMGHVADVTDETLEGPPGLASASRKLVLTRDGKLCSRCRGVGRVAVVNGDLICTFCLEAKDSIRWQHVDYVRQVPTTPEWAYSEGDFSGL